MNHLSRYFVSVADLEWYNRQLFFEGFGKKPHELKPNDCFVIQPEKERIYVFMVYELAENHFAYYCYGKSNTDDCFKPWLIDESKP